MKDLASRVEPETRLEDGFTVFDSGHPLSLETVNETLDAVRRERDYGLLSVS